MMGVLMMILLVVCVCLPAGGCGVGDVASDTTTNNTENIDSGNINIGDNASSGRVCIRCESESGLESLGYDVEEFLNCTDRCGLVDGPDTPEKEACDRACIAERIEIAAEICRQENGCEEEADPRVE